MLSEQSPDADTARHEPNCTWKRDRLPLLLLCDVWDVLQIIFCVYEYEYYNQASLLGSIIRMKNAPCSTDRLVTGNLRFIFVLMGQIYINFHPNESVHAKVSFITPLDSNAKIRETFIVISPLIIPGFPSSGIL